MKLPQRPDNHISEERSTRFFIRYLPDNWTASVPQEDYGVDLIVNIFDGHNATPYELAVQLKSSKIASNGEVEKVVLRVATYNHLRGLLNVVMIAKYIAEENEAYYILLVDIPEPNQEQNSFTLNIPKENKLSTIAWAEIEAYIKNVVDHKWNSAQAIRNRRKQLPTQ